MINIKKMNNNNLLNEFKNDFYNLVKVEDILVKYSISKSTYFVMIKKLGLKRERSSKMLRTFNMNLNSNNDNQLNTNSNTNLNDNIKKFGNIDKLTKDEKIIKKNNINESMKIVNHNIPNDDTVKVIKKPTIRIDPNNNEKLDALDEILYRAESTIKKVNDKQLSKQKK